MTSACERISGLLGPYVDGDLPPALAECVASHLADCKRCAADASALRRPLDRLRSWPAVCAVDLEELSGQREELIALFTRGRAASSPVGRQAGAGLGAVGSGGRHARPGPAAWLRRMALAAAVGWLAAGSRQVVRGAGLLLAAVARGVRPAPQESPAAGRGRPTALARAARGALFVCGALVKAAFRAGRETLAWG